MKLSKLVIIALAASLPLFASATAALVPNERSERDDDLQAFSGRWLYVEDRIEEDSVVLERARSEEPFPIDGSTVETEASGGRTRRVRGDWQNGMIEYEQN